MDPNPPQPPPPIPPPPPSPAPPPPAPVPPPPNPESQARTWNMFCHLSALCGLIGIPFGNILGPLLVWQIKKNEFPSVEVHGKASVNFQITVTLATIAATAVAVPLILLCVGYLLIPVIVLIPVAGLVFAVIAGIRANEGEEYKYPWTLELIK